MDQNIKCRACDKIFTKKIILSFDNSPTSAQGFLDEPLQTAELITLNIIQCSFCGVVQHDLKEVAYYKDVVRAIAFSSEMYTFRTKQLFDWIEDNDLHNKNIIEIGCGKGEYLQILKDCGAKQILGLENKKESLLEATSNGFNIFEGYLDKNFKSNFCTKFDAFAIFSFIEHWPNPAESFLALHKILKDDAIGLIEVPNFDLILEKGLLTEFTPDHIFYFNTKTFILFLEHNGFEVLSVESIWHDYILSAKVKKRALIKNDLFLKVKCSIANQLKEFLSKSKGSNVVWGAGHQALAVISMTKIAGLINYVVDSALFKQGKYTPGSNLLIKSPEAMNENLPECLVIMAAAYSNEVLNLVNSKFSGIKHIAVLKENGLEVIK